MVRKNIKQRASVRSAAKAVRIEHLEQRMLLSAAPLIAPWRVGGYDTGRSADGVSVVGSYAYVVDGGAGLQVIDISNPASPVRVGGYDTSGNAWGVSVVGSYAYVADGIAGLQVINISNPAAPVLVGGYDTSGAASGVSVVGSYAYVADYTAGLEVIDISNPAAPVRVGGYDTSGYAEGVSVVGSYAYVADGPAGLQVIDISNPASPVGMGGYDSGHAGGVSVVGSYAYVADADWGLQVIDISRPASPVRVGSYDTSGYARGVSVVGSYTYVADGEAGLQVISITAHAPTDMQLASASIAENQPAGTVVGSFSTSDLDVGDRLTYTLVGGTGSTDNGSFTISGNTVITAARFDYEAKSSYSIRVRTTNAGGLWFNKVFTVSVTNIDNEAPSGLTLLVSTIAENQAAGTTVGSFRTSAYAGDSLVYTLVSGTSGADNSSFTIVGDTLKTAASFDYEAKSSYSIRVRTTDSGGLWFEKVFTLSILDVPDGTIAPWRVGGYETSGDARGVSVVGSYAYVADDFAGLQVIDISNPASPVRVGGYDTSGYAYGVSVVGSYAYVADGPAGLQVIDISNPAAPKRVSGYGDDPDGHAYGVSVMGSYAYVADGPAGLQVIDISNPASPVRVGGYDRSYVEGVSVVGSYAYVVGGYAGLQVIDIRNPAAPVRVGGYDSSGQVYGVTVVGSYAYVSVYDAGLQVIDISNPASPVRVGGYDTSGWAYGVSVVGSYAYVADYGAGLEVIRISANQAPTSPVVSAQKVLRNWPANTPVGTISATDPDAGDTAGLVYRLAAGNTSPFKIVGNQLLTRAVVPATGPSSYLVKLQAVDPHGAVSENTVTVAVAGTNVVPTDIRLSKARIAENKPAGTAVGTLSAVDANAGDIFTFSLTSTAATPDNAFFIIDGTTLRTSASFSYEKKSLYTIRVKVKDNGKLVFAKNLTINVTNVNESPKAVLVSGKTVAENSPGGTLVGTLSARDRDASQTFTYSLIDALGVRLSADNQAFKVVQATTGWQLQAKAGLNYEAKNTYGLVVRATDQGGLFCDTAITIGVTDVNEAPTDVKLKTPGTTTPSVLLNAAAGSVVGTLRATDPDAGNTFTYSLISTTAAGAAGLNSVKFSISGNQLLVGGSPLTYAKGKSYRVLVRVTDQDALSYDKALLIVVR